MECHLYTRCWRGVPADSGKTTYIITDFHNEHVSQSSLTG